MKLKAKDMLKAVHTVIQRGMFERGDVKTVLWGSRDLYHWFLIGSSMNEAIHNLRGSGYKYFRIGGIATLPEDKSVCGASVEVESQFGNKLR